MRIAGVACLLAVCSGVLLAGERRVSAGAEPPRPLTNQGQGQVEALVRESADAAAASARYWLGNLHPAGQLAFRKWILAVASWKKEKGAGSAPLLAEGVLFDCLGRTLGLNTGFTSGSAVDPRFNELGLPNRLERAARLFESALQADPNLLEARFRAFRIRALDDPRAALELERIATSRTDVQVSYLSAVSRAVIAQGRKEAATAIRWYQYAQELHARSTAAAIGLSVLAPGVTLSFESLDPDDPYYSYPCRILTPSVSAELSRRIQASPGK